MVKLSLDQIVASVNDIPALPQITVQVIRLTGDPDSTVEDVSKVINQDQGLTAKILKLANSAYYGFPRRIGTVSEATVLLGFQTIKSIAMAVSVNELLSKEVPGYALATGELWRHSQACAIAARHLARAIRFPHPEQVYTAGLLHDIGKVVLNRYLHEYYHEVVNRAGAGDITFAQAEEEILGFNHAEVGCRIADKWNLPPELVEAIAFHHTPEQAQVNPCLTDIVHLADAMVMMMGIGLGVDGLDYYLSPDILEKLGLSLETVEQIMLKLSEVLADQSSFLL